MNTPRKNATDKAVLFRVCDLFFRERKKVSEIAGILNREFRASGQSSFTRERIYPMLASAERHGLVRLVPPLEQQYPSMLSKRYGQVWNGLEPQHFRVVNAEHGETGAHVAASAAELVLDLIEELWDKRSRQAREQKRPIGLGLGPGRATAQVCRELGHLLEGHSGLPDHSIQLHAITAGGPVSHPEYAPNSFFHLLPDRLIAGRIGLFAETLVTRKEFETIKQRGDIADAFERKHEIDIVVTSRGSTNDDHDLFRLSIERIDADIAQRLRELGWVGNVQYRPYTMDGPAPENKQKYRAVTLFELSDFRLMAQMKDKFVVLIARRCSLCDNLGIDALLPLLSVSELKVWSHMVLDLAVAKGLIEEAEGNSQSSEVNDF